MPRLCLQVESCSDFNGPHDLRTAQHGPKYEKHSIFNIFYIMVKKRKRILLSQDNLPPKG